MAFLSACEMTARQLIQSFQYKQHSLNPLWPRLITGVQLYHCFVPSHLKAIYIPSFPLDVQLHSSACYRWIHSSDICFRNYVCIFVCSPRTETVWSIAARPLTNYPCVSSHQSTVSFINSASSSIPWWTSTWQLVAVSTWLLICVWRAQSHCSLSALDISPLHSNTCVTAHLNMQQLSPAVQKTTWTRPPRFICSQSHGFMFGGVKWGLCGLGLYNILFQHQHCNVCKHTILFSWNILVFSHKFNTLISGNIWVVLQTFPTLISGNIWVLFS